MVKYYSPLPELNTITIALNDTMTQVAAQLASQPGFAPVRFADGYLAFQFASALFNHDACQAGLLIRLPRLHRSRVTFILRPWVGTSWPPRCNSPGCRGPEA